MQLGNAALVGWLGNLRGVQLGNAALVGWLGNLRGVQLGNAALVGWLGNLRGVSFGNSSHGACWVGMRLINSSQLRVEKVHWMS